MTKRITFGDKDEELVKEIWAFQESQNLPHFVDAVRVLCRNGLRMSNIVKGLQ